MNNQQSNNLCACGCGIVTNTAPCNRNTMGLKKGDHYKFIAGHHNPRLGSKHSEETKLNFSIARKGKKYPNRKSPENGAWNKGTHESGMKGKHHADESKRKSAINNSGQKRSDECRAKLKVIHRERWADREYRERQIKKIMSRSVPNKKEMWLEKHLNDLYPGEWKFVGNGQLIIAGKCPDFVNINGQKKIIEYYGDYWHQGQDPTDRADIFSPFGYETLVIWESELKDMAKVNSRLHTFCVGAINV